MVEETLKEYQREGRLLYQRLYLEQYPIHNTEDAKRYIASSQRYEFIARMFSDMAMYSWLKEDFEINV